MNILERLQALRAQMAEQGLDAYGTANADPHASEYVAEHYCMRKFLSGFTGSAGTLLVTQEDAALFTDGRYVVQAARQLEGTGIRMVLIGGPGEPSMEEWLAQRIPGGKLGWDLQILPAATARSLEKALRLSGIRLVGAPDLTQKIWSDRPALPANPVWAHDLRFCGVSVPEKLAQLREDLRKSGATAQLLGRLEDIAWLFNIRGGDIACLPVAYAWALITREKAMLFLQEGVLEAPARTMLEEAGVDLLPYDGITEAVQALDAQEVLALDPARINAALLACVPCQTVEQDDITTLLKAVKNSTEQAGIRASAVRDGVAMVRFLYWLDHVADRAAITEETIAEKLTEYRSAQANYLEPSFNTIAAYRDHGAMMHYSATPETAYSLEGDGVMVVDSGACYLDGTTDITRTPVLGTISQEIRDDYTLVLRSHIALASTKFLDGASAATLDAIARRPLWQVGLEYRCGTGHGVGYCLSVHEGPSNFSQKGRMIPLKPGMLITIEPGIYREGQWGIRIENMVLVVEDSSNEYGAFYRFEPVTYCPIDLRGIDPAQLNEEERAYLNDYHAMVYSKLAPHLSEEEAQWLKEATRAV